MFLCFIQVSKWSCFPDGAYIFCGGLSAPLVLSNTSIWSCHVLVSASSKRSFVSALWWGWYRYGVCSSSAELTECNWKILWTCIYLGMVLSYGLYCSWFIITTTTTTYWESFFDIGTENSGCTLFYYYYYSISIICFWIISLWPFILVQMVFSSFFQFNRIVTVYGMYLGPSYFKALFLNYWAVHNIDPLIESFEMLLDQI